MSAATLALDLFAIEDAPAPAPVAEADPDPDAQVLASLPDDWRHALAFVAVCRAAGIDDPALRPTSSEGGMNQFSRVHLSRLANRLLRGVESDRPAMTPERWAEAAQAVLGGAR